MSFDLAHPLPLALALAFTLLSAGLALSLYRVYRGPTPADRVIALDLVTYLAIGFSAALAVAREDVHLLRPALTLALLAFLGTIAFARYLERRALR